MLSTLLSLALKSKRLVNNMSDDPSNPFGANAAVSTVLFEPVVKLISQNPSYATTAFTKTENREQQPISTSNKDGFQESTYTFERTVSASERPPPILLVHAKTSYAAAMPRKPGPMGVY